MQTKSSRNSAGLLVDASKVRKAGYWLGSVVQHGARALVDEGGAREPGDHRVRGEAPEAGVERGGGVGEVAEPGQHAVALAGLEERLHGRPRDLLALEPEQGEQLAAHLPHAPVAVEQRDRARRPGHHSPEDLHEP